VKCAKFCCLLVNLNKSKGGNPPELHIGSPSQNLTRSIAPKGYSFFEHYYFPIVLRDLYKILPLLLSRYYFLMFASQAPHALTYDSVSTTVLHCDFVLSPEICILTVTHCHSLQYWYTFCRGPVHKICQLGYQNNDQSVSLIPKRYYRIPGLQISQSRIPELRIQSRDCNH